ncbi:MAG: hypothetical protein R3248_12375 [Candidatus Promineifilaceae bacterium]|nr:hypothetical protein [Candidatus Promineifilaceae bacterium]
MSKLEWVLSSILAVLLVIVLALLLRFWLERNPGPAGEAAETAQQVVEARTARTSYQVAQPVAQQWAADAKLLNARAAWPEGDSFEPEAATWNFVFYSPGQSATALISVSQNEGRLISNRETDRRLNIYATTGWQVDSPQLLSIVMENGGRTFLEQYGEGKLTMTLDTNNQFVWRARLINTEVPASLTLQVDPNSGEMISSEESP